MNTQQTTTSIQQLADLTGYDPSWFTHRRDQLPQAVVVHTGRAGRPAKQFNLADLADFALRHTGRLSDAECRLICAFRQLATSTAEGEQS